MEPTRHGLPLILARELASNLATPLAIIDHEGRLVFFNEPAQQFIGSTPSELGELSEEEWRARFTADLPDGTPASLDDMPSVRARRDRAPAHETLVITTNDGEKRTLEVTAFPLLGERDSLVGVVAVFWQTRA